MITALSYLFNRAKSLFTGILMLTRNATGSSNRVSVSPAPIVNRVMAVCAM
jgi:hypothetical protein